jgi:hypothetical protein
LIAWEVDRSLLVNLALQDVAELPADEWSGHHDGSRAFGVSEAVADGARPIDPRTYPARTIQIGGRAV